MDFYKNIKNDIAILSGSEETARILLTESIEFMSKQSPRTDKDGLPMVQDRFNIALAKSALSQCETYKDLVTFLNTKAGLLAAAMPTKTRSAQIEARKLAGFVRSLAGQLVRDSYYLQQREQQNAPVADHDDQGNDANGTEFEGIVDVEQIMLEMVWSSGDDANPALRDVHQLIRTHLMSRTDARSRFNAFDVGGFRDSSDTWVTFIKPSEVWAHLRSLTAKRLADEAEAADDDILGLAAVKTPTKDEEVDILKVAEAVDA